MTDFYHDDPIEEAVVKRAKPKALFGSALLLFAGGLFLNTTLAANISLNSDGRVEFGQGVSITTACSQGISLTITPQSEFRNVAGGGAHYVKSIKVSGIPSSCNGKDFNISLYDNVADSGPLPIFETSTAVATVWNNGGTFVEGYNGTGSTITSGSGTFTVTFNSPVALSSDAQKITVESAEHRRWDCQSGKRPCAVGDTGPGGGIVFYAKAAGFKCGPTWSATCKNMEVAPSGWGGATDPTAKMFNVKTTNISDMWSGSGMPNDYESTNGTYLGRGYQNTLRLIAYDDGSTANAAGGARAYAGGGLNDWYLPSWPEMHALCQWNIGQSMTPVDRCNVGNGYYRNAVRFGAQLTGMTGKYHQTSSQANYYSGGTFNFADADQYNPTHTRTRLEIYRPIRAF